MKIKTGKYVAVFDDDEDDFTERYFVMVFDDDDNRIVTCIGSTPEEAIENYNSWADEN